LIGSNRQYIDEVIPHIGSLLSTSLGDVVKEAEVVVIGTRGVGVDKLRSSLRPEHIVIDLVNLDRKSRPANSGDYEGICW
jgi:GDP-mannose 6-dehydrogenase